MPTIISLSKTKKGAFQMKKNCTKKDRERQAKNHKEIREIDKTEKKRRQADIKRQEDTI
jgi:hypothetical protein